MRVCPICKIGFIVNNTKAIFSFEKNGTLFIVKNKNAKCCNNCGEAFHSLNKTQQVFLTSETENSKGTELRILKLLMCRNSTNLSFRALARNLA